MYYAVAFYPDVDPEPINRIRRKYDPTEPIIEPHIAVVFPVPESVGEDNLAHHVEGVLSSWKPFPVRMSGFKKSFDHWLFLTLEEGYDDVVRLYRELNTGILDTYRRDDIEFIPHISLGLFLEEGTTYDWEHPHRLVFDEEGYERALEEARKEGLDFRCTVDCLNLIEIPADVMEWFGGQRACFEENSKVVKGRPFLL
jgi:hypothetical protein